MKTRVTRTCPSYLRSASAFSTWGGPSASSTSSLHLSGAHGFDHRKSSSLATPGKGGGRWGGAPSSTQSSCTTAAVEASWPPRHLHQQQRRWTANFRAVIKLVRHGESMANTGDLSHLEVGDHNIPLTTRGRRQARRAGQRIGPEFIDDSLVFCSPYRRAQQTLEEILVGSGALEQPGQLEELELRVLEEDEEDVESGSNNVSMGAELKASDHAGRERSDDMPNTTRATTLDRPPRPYRIREDPRLREVDHGYEDLQAQEAKREKHGWFYYRFNGGESPADCYDRTSIFMESLIRQVERKSSREQKPVKVLIVSHGLTIRCFVMRYLHLRVADMDTVANPNNCDIITLALKDDLSSEFGKDSWLFSTGRWAVHGLRKRVNNRPTITDHITGDSSPSSS